jgi:hypothetical protein
MKTTIICSIVGIVCFGIGAVSGWHRGARHGSHQTAKDAQAEMQNQNSLLLLIENAMYEPDESKDDSVRSLISSSLLQYESYQNVYAEPPWSVEPLHRDDVMISEARKRLNNRKIKLRYVEE